MQEWETAIVNVTIFSKYYSFHNSGMIISNVSINIMKRENLWYDSKKWLTVFLQKRIQVTIWNNCKHVYVYFRFQKYRL